MPVANIFLLTVFVRSMVNKHRIRFNNDIICATEEKVVLINNKLSLKKIQRFGIATSHFFHVFMSFAIPHRSIW